MCQDKMLSSGQEFHAALTCLASRADTSRRLDDDAGSFDLPPKGLDPARSIVVALSLSVPLWAMIGFASWILSGPHPS